MDQSKILYTEEQIKERMQELAREIASDYKDKNPILIGVLNGSYITMADLTRALYKEGLTDLEVDFLSVSSYGSGTEYSGTSTVISDIRKDIKGRDVLIVEDIIDTGHTLKFIQEYLAKKDPATLKIFAMLDKKEKRETEVSVAYVGFALEGKPWIEGYGLDGGEYGRGRADIAEKITS
jgi:hypoxanthine phosphoribosyltransferase